MWEPRCWNWRSPRRRYRRVRPRPHRLFRAAGMSSGLTRPWISLSSLSLPDGGDAPGDGDILATVDRPGLDRGFDLVEPGLVGNDAVSRDEPNNILYIPAMIQSRQIKAMSRNCAGRNRKSLAGPNRKKSVDWKGWPCTEPI